jgi:hypothetical protein
MIILLVSVVIAACAGLAALVRRLARQYVSSNGPSAGTEWIEELSIERYRPMLRLLSQDDLEFLRTQPGFTPQMLAKVRIQRCQLFREYMRNLDVDFKRVCMALKMILLRSEVDRPDLASGLVRHQMLFAYRKLRIQFQLVLFRYGFGTVDVSNLVSLFDGMRRELQTLVPVGSCA